MSPFHDRVNKSNGGSRVAEGSRIRSACHSPFDWETVAATWEGYWAGVLDRRPRLPPDHPWVMTECPECGSGRLALADGYHCLGCGLYGPSL